MFYKYINILYSFTEKLKLIKIYFFFIKRKNILELNVVRIDINNQTFSNYFWNPIYYDFIYFDRFIFLNNSEFYY